MAIGNGQEGTIAPEGWFVVCRQLGAADTRDYLLVVIMDGENTQRATGWTAVKDIGRIVVRPAEDALQVVYVKCVECVTNGIQRITSSLTLANFALSSSLMGCAR